MGAGPAGLALALALAERGLAVTLVESSRSAHQAVRGEALMPSGLAALKSLGLSPLPPGVPWRRLSGWSFQIEGRELFCWPEPAAPEAACTLIDQRALLQAWRQRALGLPQLTLLEGLAAVDLLHDPSDVGGSERAGGTGGGGGLGGDGLGGDKVDGSKLGGNKVSGNKVSGGKVSGGKVSGVRLADGRELSADLVVACDGRSSLLRQRAGLACTTRTDPQEVLWFLLDGAGVQPLVEWLGGRFVTVVGSGAAYAVFERAAGGVQLGLLQPAGKPLTSSSPAGWKARWAAAAPSFLAHLLEGLEDGAVVGPQRLPVPVGCAERWQRSGLLLLGDAAHPMSPLRAQGLNMALRDAQVAARVLLPVLRAGDAAGLDAALQAIGTARHREILAIQALQRREALLGEVLQQAPALRRLLAVMPAWGAPLLAQRWAASQRRLRQGVMTLSPLG
ncbi:MAG: FAD-dependent monooxygenase [Synechococcaceae cyanobacterium]